MEKETSQEQFAEILETWEFLRWPSDESAFDLPFARRWIFERVIDLGWQPDLFLDFDRRVGRWDMGRSTRKPEPIGMKYQWIALHELAARALDNFEPRDPPRHGERGYAGPWDTPLRDLDPSLLLEVSKSEDWHAPETWWSPSSFSAWGQDVSPGTWLKDAASLPDPLGFIEPVDPGGTPRLTLHGHYSWTQPRTPPQEARNEPYGRLFYIVNGYLVTREDRAAARDWVTTTDFFGRNFPEGPAGGNFFAGEFPLGAAAVTQHDRYHGREEWQKAADDGLQVHALWDEYRYEGASDGSVDGTITFDLPSRLVLEGLKLRWGGVSSEFVDVDERVLALDPSVHERGPGALLVEKSALLRWLDDSKTSIVWTVLGEVNLLATYGDSPGRLVVSGGYYLENNAVEGGVRTRYMAHQDR